MRLKRPLLNKKTFFFFGLSEKTTKYLCSVAQISGYGSAIVWRCFSYNNKKLVFFSLVYQRRYPNIFVFRGANIGVCFSNSLEVFFLTVYLCKIDILNQRNFKSYRRMLCPKSSTPLPPPTPYRRQGPRLRLAISVRLQLSVSGPVCESADGR